MLTKRLGGASEAARRAWLCLRGVAASTLMLGAIKPFATCCKQQVRDKMDENESRTGSSPRGRLQEQGWKKANLLGRVYPRLCKR